MESFVFLSKHAKIESEEEDDDMESFSHQDSKSSFILKGKLTVFSLRIVFL